MKKRIVVTGIGVVSSIGIGKEQFWKALLEGTSGITTISSFDTTLFPTHRGGEVKNFHPEDFFEKCANRPIIGKASYFAAASARLALLDAGVDLATNNPRAVGIVVGTTMGETQIVQELNEQMVRKGIHALDPRLVQACPTQRIANNVAALCGITGNAYVIPTACAAGNYAIGYAYDCLQREEAMMMLAGGADAFSRIAFTGFNRLFAVAPERCQPFDRNRKGMMVGEGSGMVVLETLEHARKRNAPIYAEILGYGLSCDAFHMTAPEPQGVARGIASALEASCVSKDEVDYINAHGTGTPTNDKVESEAIHLVFKERASQIPVSSIKSMLGHTMGAASAIEAIACCLSVLHDVIPPTINFETPDPACPVDCVPNVARSQRVDIALNNASAFGGNNACLVLKKFLS
ncbi:MAG: beta-ketoacyl-[acyl-carrier-protein] synthase family protein [Candidatus Omnitrophica bacterium]|nr:beta-ketoacyl-[acyl-carrier-protein] synthase family protein [Candidatus Omnitrophota bacterium]